MNFNNVLFTKSLTTLPMLFVVALSVAAQEKEWQLVWSDEFNRDGRPDTAVWNYEHGFVRNQEAQWYQAENAWLQDGLLIIEARKEQRDNPTYRPNGRYWGEPRRTG